MRIPFMMCIVCISEPFEAIGLAQTGNSSQANFNFFLNPIKLSQKKNINMTIQCTNAYIHAATRIHVFFMIHLDVF